MEVFRVFDEKYSKTISYSIQNEVIEERSDDDYPSPATIWWFWDVILPII